MSARIALIALLLAGCAASPSVVTKTDVRRAPRQDPAGRRAEDSSRPVTIDSDRMQRVGAAPLVIFSGDVIARLDSAVHYADRVEVYLDEKNDRIRRIVSTGNVRIVTRDRGEAKARRADYDDATQRVVLRGDVRVWQRERVVSGECLVIDLRWGGIEPCPGKGEVLGADELQTQAPPNSNARECSLPPSTAARSRRGRASRRSRRRRGSARSRRRVGALRLRRARTWR